MQKNVTIFDHPLISHKLAILRDETTTSKQFRELVEEIGMLMTYEVCRELPTREVTVKTPIATTTCRMLTSDVAVVPI